MIKKLLGVLVLALVIFGGFWWLNNDDENTVKDDDVEQTQAQDESTAETKVSLTINEADAPLADAVIGDNVQTLELGNFFFEPNQLTFAAGSTVALDLKNSEGFHDFVIDELGVQTETFSAGTTERVEFTIPADASGEYKFYCSIGNHREQGMEGTLIVQ